LGKEKVSALWFWLERAYLIFLVSAVTHCRTFASICLPRSDSATEPCAKNCIKSVADLLRGPPRSDFYC